MFFRGRTIWNLRRLLFLNLSSYPFIVESGCAAKNNTPYGLIFFVRETCIKVCKFLCVLAHIIIQQKVVLNRSSLICLLSGVAGDGFLLAGSTQVEWRSWINAFDGV